MKYRYKFLALVIAMVFLSNIVSCIGVNASSNSTNYTVGITNNKVYYIMNASTSRLLYSNTSNTSDYASVKTVNTNSLNWASDATKWELNRLSSGSFEIYGGAGYGAILKVIDDYDIETESNEGGTNTKFVLTRSTDSFQGTYTIMNDGKYLTYDSDNNSLYLLSASSPSDYSYWSLMAVERRDVDFYTFTYTYPQGDVTATYDTSMNGDTFLSTMSSLGYTNRYHLNNFNYPEEITTYLQNDDIFIFFGKGAPSELRFYSDNHTLYGQIMADSGMAGSNDYNQYFINSIPDNGLSQLRCVILLADNVGNPSDDGNMVEAIYNKGAHFVLAITENNMNEQMVNLWLGIILNQIQAGSNIHDAIEAADDYFEENDYQPITSVSRGDDNQILKMG